MSETLRRIQTLVLAGDYLVTSHGFDELAEDGILPNEVVEGITTAGWLRTRRRGIAARAF